jgi:hypothetical protein
MVTGAGVRVVIERLVLKMVRVVGGGHFVDATTLQNMDFWGAGWRRGVEGRID